MKKFLMICMLFSLAACSGNKEENKDVAAKKAELEKLTKERDDIIAKIGTLETEIQKMSGATVEEKTKGVAIGYNLGPVTIQAQYRDIENNSGAETLDGKIGGVKISTKF